MANTVPENTSDAPPSRMRESMRRKSVPTNGRTDAEKEHIKSESAHTEAEIFDHGGIENAAAVVNDAERSALQQTTADQHPPGAVDAAGVVHIISLLYPVIAFKKYIVK